MKSKKIFILKAYGFERKRIYGLEWYVYHLLLRIERLSVVEITTVTITIIRKKVTIQRVVRVPLLEKGLKISIFKFMVNISMGQRSR